MERETPIERKALYNLLRMQWLLDPTLEVDPWQVQDFRTLPLEELFDRLQEHELWLDQARFIAFANEVDTPEELTETLVGDREDLDEIDEDLIYLLIFELWRRLVPEKQSLTIFCDELDQLILGYDQETLSDIGDIEDAIDNLLAILSDASVEGPGPNQAFEALASGCANDLESFLYDYIQDLIQEQQFAYAQELVDELAGYLKEPKWFYLLKVQILAHEEANIAEVLLKKVWQNYTRGEDREFDLALLAACALVIDDAGFYEAVNETLPHLENHEEWRELLITSREFLLRQDRDQDAKRAESLLEEIVEGAAFSPHNSSALELLELLRVD